MPWPVAGGRQWRDRIRVQFTWDMEKEFDVWNEKKKAIHMDAAYVFFHPRDLWFAHLGIAYVDYNLRRSRGCRGGRYVNGSLTYGRCMIPCEQAVFETTNPGSEVQVFPAHKLIPGLSRGTLVLGSLKAEHCSPKSASARGSIHPIGAGGIAGQLMTAVSIHPLAAALWIR